MQISHLSDPSGPFSAHRVGSFKDPFHVHPYTLPGNVHIRWQYIPTHKLTAHFQTPTLRYDLNWPLN